MTPRLATLADIPRLVEMGAKFHAASNQACPYDPEEVAALTARMIDSHGAAVLCHDTGMIGGALITAYCAPSWIIAVEMFWWADGGGMALLRAFEAWATEMGASEVRMTTLTNLPKADKILRCKGYSASEISYSKVI